MKTLAGDGHLGTPVGSEALEAEGLTPDIATGGVPPMALDVWLNKLGILRGSSNLEVHIHLDVSKLGFTNARWLVSRKKVRGLADIMNKLKHETLDERSRLEDLHQLAVSHTLLDTELADGEQFHFFADMDV
jgi:hypothetical protein